MTEKTERKCPKCNGDVIKRGKTDLGRQRWQCKACLFITTNPTSRVEAPEFKYVTPGGKRFIITSAVNATPAHKGFLNALKAWVKYNSSSHLIVIPLRYRNPTSQWTKGNDHYEWWDSDIVPFLYDGRLQLGERVQVLADIKTQPTARRPLTTLQTISGDCSGILGHTKIELQTVPTPQHKFPKIMTTTAAVTVSNYSDTKIGKHGEFHHTVGATIVELDGERHHIRQVNAMEDGSFIDLDWEYLPDESRRKAEPALALTLGDSHVDFADPKVVEATFDRGGIARKLKPKYIVFHDLLDFYSANHHHKSDPFIAIAKNQSRQGNVRDEVERACQFVDKHLPKGSKGVVVSSNHPEAFCRWVKETDWRSDPENAEFYLETALHMVKETKMGKAGAEYPDPFVFWSKKWLKSRGRIKFLGRNDTFILKGVDYGHHGDLGINGGRGSLNSFSKVGVKSVIGHSHSPGIRDGAYQVGTSSYLNLEYTSGGLSSWLNTHCVQYANGKRSLIHIIDGKWKL